jgi:hypothetical protein
MLKLENKTVIVGGSVNPLLKGLCHQIRIPESGIVVKGFVWT